MQALSAPYYDGKDDGDDANTPLAFNMLWEEIQLQENILPKIETYKSWVDKYIWNEIEYPLNDSGLANTIWNEVERIKNQKHMSSKFNPFKVADHIWFNGLNPNNQLTDDELSLVEMVVNYHAKPRYDYKNQRFVDAMSTQYAYYRELEFCEYVKLVMFIMNNLNSFKPDDELSYDISSNKFIQTAKSMDNCIRVVQIFNEGSSIVKNKNGTVALDHKMLLRVSEFLCKYAFHIQAIRENMKTIA